MSLQFGTVLRTALVAAIESAIGASPKVRIYTGAPPANPAAAATGTLLAEFALGADWAAQASGVLTFSGVPISTAAVAPGTAGYYRLLDNAGTVTHMQGNVTATGGGGDMTVDNPVIANTQQVQITSWTITAPNA